LLTSGLRTSESATPTPAASLERTYTVVAGDTLSSIAQKEYGEASKYTLIVAANPGLDASHLRLKQTIKIPPAPTPSLAASTTDTSDWNHGSTTRPSGDVNATGNVYTVQDGDSLWTIAKQVYGDAKLCTAIEKSNHGVSSATLRKGQKLSCPPFDVAQRLAGVSATPTTRPAGLASTDSFGSETGTRLSSPGRALAHVGTSTTAHAAVPADDGKPRFPVHD
jgi:LysM repeat protein